MDKVLIKIMHTKNQLKLVRVFVYRFLTYNVFSTYYELKD